MASCAWRGAALRGMEKDGYGRQHQRQNGIVPITPPTSGRFRGVEEGGLLQAHARFGERLRAIRTPSSFRRPTSPAFAYGPCAQRRPSRTPAFAVRRMLGYRRVGSSEPTTPASPPRLRSTSLASQGISRLEIGREAFIEACQVAQGYGTTIVNQIKGMGCSCDYDDRHFTLEPASGAPCGSCSPTGTTTDIIYRGKRIVNWCPQLHHGHRRRRGRVRRRTGASVASALPAHRAGVAWSTWSSPRRARDDARRHRRGGEPQDERFQDTSSGKTVKLPLVDREIPSSPTGTSIPSSARAA